MIRGLPFQNFEAHFTSGMWWLSFFFFFFFLSYWQVVLLINIVEKIKTVGSVDMERVQNSSASDLCRLSTLHPSSQPHNFWWSPPSFRCNTQTLSYPHPLPRACHIRHAKIWDSFLVHELYRIIQTWCSHSESHIGVYFQTSKS